MRNKYEIKGNLTEIECFYKNEAVVCTVDTKNLPKLELLGKISATRSEGDNTLYATARVLGTSGHSRIYLHRFLIDAPEDTIVDHKDRNGLNNLEENIHVTNHVGNARNKKIQTTNTSGYPGVGWSKKYSKWHARIWVNNKQIHLGYFGDKDMAIQIRKDAEKQYWV